MNNVNGIAVDSGDIHINILDNKFSSPGRSKSSPTNAASSVKDAKKKNATQAPKNIRV